MITKESQAGIGAPRPYRAGLSSTVRGLNWEGNARWPEVYAANRFGEEAPVAGFNPAWASRATTIVLGVN